MKRLTNGEQKKEHQGFLLNHERLSAIDDPFELSLFNNFSKIMTFISSAMLLVLCVFIGFIKLKPYFETATAYVIGGIAIYCIIEGFLRTNKKLGIFKKHVYAYLISFSYLAILLIFSFLVCSIEIFNYPFEDDWNWLFLPIYFASFLLVSFSLYLFCRLAYQKEISNHIKGLKDVKRGDALTLEDNRKIVLKGNSLSISSSRERSAKGRIDEQHINDLYENEPLDLCCNQNILNLDKIKEIRDKKVFTTLTSCSGVAFAYSVAIATFGMFIGLFGLDNVVFDFSIFISLLFCSLPMGYAMDKYFDRCNRYRVFKKMRYPIAFILIYILLGLVSLLLSASIKTFDYSLPGIGQGFLLVIYLAIYIACLVIYQSILNKTYDKFFMKCYKRLERIEKTLNANGVH